MKSNKTVLMISKPIIPPWNDSAKNIVKDQITNGTKYNYRIMTTGEPHQWGEHITCDPIYNDAGTYSAGIKQNIKVMLHGLRPKGANLYHYFFAPNPVSAMAGRVQKTVARTKTIQTVCSQPASFHDLHRLIFTDRIIVLSKDTRDKFINGGLDAGRVKYIPPGIIPIAPKTHDERQSIRDQFGIGPGPMILFPGDFEFSSAAHLVSQNTPQLLNLFPNATIVFACRIKREASKDIQAEIQKDLEQYKNNVLFLNEVNHMPSLVGAADVVIMPADSLYAKMDVPLVLLEAMSQKIPLVIAQSSPLGELLETGGAMGMDPKKPGTLIDPIKQILENPQMAQSLGEAGRNSVLSTFNVKEMAKQVENLYDELLGN